MTKNITMFNYKREVLDMAPSNHHQNFAYYRWIVPLVFRH